jgi:hypothetical protein
VFLVNDILRISLTLATTTDTGEVTASFPPELEIEGAGDTNSELKL